MTVSFAERLIRAYVEADHVVLNECETDQPFLFAAFIDFVSIRNNLPHDIIDAERRSHPRIQQFWREVAFCWQIVDLELQKALIKKPTL